MSLFKVIFLALAVAVASAAGAHFTVEVGANSTLTFNPKTIIAQPGDVVTYNFHPKVGSTFNCLNISILT